MKKIILDLCAGTGAWSYFYKVTVGWPYQVIQVTLPQDVREYEPPDKVHGILMAPPCTHFSIARLITPAPFTDQDIKDSLSIVDTCLSFVNKCNPEWWCLENPATGILSHYLGEPKETFQPWEYGNPWTKHTGLWGDFIMPPKTVTVKPRHLTSSDDLTLGYLKRNPSFFRHVLDKSNLSRADTRAITPAGFARAFRQANP